MNYRRVTVVTFSLFLLELLFVSDVQTEKTKDPFYIIAHMANNRESVDWAVKQGANAIESDFQFHADGQPRNVEHGYPCDCVCDGLQKNHICRQGLRRKCAGSRASNDAAAHLQHIARLPNIALFIVDSKVKAKWGSRLIKAGKAIIPFLDENLFAYGYKGKVVIGSSKVNTYDYIQAAVQAANHSVNNEHYFFTFDGEEDNYADVISFLSRLTSRRVYGTGTTSCSGETFHTAINDGVTGKTKGENGLTYIWTLDQQSSMENYINRGVQGIVTNRVGLAKQVATGMGLTMATSSTSIPISTVSMSSGDKCDCDYHPGGCIISYPAPIGKACQCQYTFLWTCEGSLVSCDVSHPKCSAPDESKEACQLGMGDCDGY